MSELVESLHFLWEIITTVGSIFGLFTGLIVIFRFIKERPLLKIQLLAHHQVLEVEGSTIFHFDLDIDNVGDRPTTIKNIYYSITDKKEKNWHYGFFEDFNMFNLDPRSSAKFSQAYTVADSFTEHMKVFLTIEHTHGDITKKYESISPKAFFG